MAVTGWDDTKFDEVRRMAGDRGGVCPPALYSELYDGLLCIVGVFERSLLAMELEPGVLRRGLFCNCWALGAADTVCCLTGEATGEDGGRAVAVAVPSESRLRPSESMLPWLFIDPKILPSLECSCP